MFTADLLADSLTAGWWLSWFSVGPASWEVVGSYPGPANGQTFKSSRIREVPSHLCSWCCGLFYVVYPYDTWVLSVVKCWDILASSSYSSNPRVNKDMMIMIRKRRAYSNKAKSVNKDL